MASTYNATPRVIFDGTRDRSRRALIRPETTYAQHLPLLRLFTETGPTETTYIGNTSDGFASIFGQASLDPRSKFFNQQSLLALNLLSEANGFMVKRLRPDDAANPARIILALDLVRDLVPQTITRLSGFNFPALMSDISNGPVASDTDMVEGFRARLVLIKDNSHDIGSQKVLPGDMVSNIDGSQSTLYPLMELPAAFFGSQGNQLGLRIWATSDMDLDGYDTVTTREQKTRIYRTQFVEQMPGETTPTLIQTAIGADYMNVSFDPGTYSVSTDSDLYIGEVLTNAYSDTGDNGLTPLYSPFSQVYVYQKNVDMVRELIQDTEAQVDPTFQDAPGQIDFLTMTAISGNPYKSILLEGPLEGGVMLGKNSTVYAVGGNDGTTDLAEYVKLVDRENTNFGKLGDEYENIAKYQFGFIYDTGLPMSSKYKMMQVLGGVRRDLQCMFTTMVEGEEQGLTITEEASRAQAIMTRLKAFPESVLFGTKVCRAMIVTQSGRLIASGFNKRTPQVQDVAMKWAKYAGAGNGILNPEAIMDVHPNNEVSILGALNVEFFNARVSSNLWSNGVTYSTSYDDRRQYYPCFRSVYLDDTSVLLSPITVNICCVIMRLIHKVHARFSGRSDLTAAQLVERCDQEILDITRDLFGGRVDILPRTEITAMDDQNGFSWTCTVTVAANNPRTVMNFHLETIRKVSPVETQ